MLIALASSCFGNQNIVAKKSQNRWKLELSDIQAKALFELVFKGYAQGGNFQITVSNGSCYLYSEGENSIYRINLEESNGYLVIGNNNNIMGESCSGVNCEKCSFVESGGCSCSRAGTLNPPSGPSSYCNHSITKLHLSPEMISTMEAIFSH